MKILWLTFSLLLRLSALVSGVAAAADNDIVPGTADFVIVGGGTAGCVLASRLCTELPLAKIVLLERGAPRTDEEEFIVNNLRENYDIYESIDPAGNVFNYFPTEPNPALVNPATGQPGRRIVLIEGATLGGTSNVAFQWSNPINGSVDEWGINGLDSATANALYDRAAVRIGVQQPPSELLQDYTQDVINAFVSFILSRGEDRTG
jgi:hypothetical protein